jgi:hypothetical protein
MSKDADALRAKGFIETRPDVWTRAASLDSRQVAAAERAAVPLKMVVRKSSDVEKLNKTEAAFLQRLKLLHPGDWIGVQNITLKLADDTRYSCDFFHWCEGQLLAYEVKGFRREDSWVKLKVAARMFPMIQFFLVRRVSGGGWSIKPVKP